MANRTQLFWSAKTSLIPGQALLLVDLVPRRVAIPGGDNSYISANKDVTRFIVLRTIGAGELLPASAVSPNTKVPQMSAVPISVQTSDLPADLQSGEAVNLYHVGDPNLAKEIGPPSLVLSHAYILGVDRKGQNLGGNLTLTLSVSTRNILPLLNATASGRVVVVRING